MAAAPPGHATQAPAAGSYALPVIALVPPGRVLDTDAMAYSLSRYTGGKVTLLSFMYSYCADPRGCPEVMRTMLDLRTRLLRTPALAARVRFVSLSFDPRHDTPETLRLYAGQLADPANRLRWFFLTTRSTGQLQPILDGFGQAVQLQRDAAGQPMRFFYHQVKVFLIDGDARVREIYSTAFLQPDFIYNDVQTLLMEQQQGVTVAMPAWLPPA